MKKRTIIIVVALLLIPIAALSFTPDLWMRASTGNAVVDGGTGLAAIQTKPGYFYGIIVHTNGTNATEIDIYDHSTSAALITDYQLIDSWLVTTSSTDRTQSISFDPPVPYEHGIYVDASNSVSITYDIYYHASDD